MFPTEPDDLITDKLAELDLLIFCKETAFPMVSINTTP
jgi:hypothetical protein